MIPKLNSASSSDCTASVQQQRKRVFFRACSDNLIDHDGNVTFNLKFNSLGSVYMLLSDLWTCKITFSSPQTLSFVASWWLILLQNWIKDVFFSRDRLTSFLLTWHVRDALVRSLECLISWVCFSIFPISDCINY